MLRSYQQFCIIHASIKYAKATTIASWASLDVLLSAHQMTVVSQCFIFIYASSNSKSKSQKQTPSAACFHLPKDCIISMNLLVMHKSNAKESLDLQQANESESTNVTCNQLTNLLSCRTMRNESINVWLRCESWNCRVLKQKLRKAPIHIDSNV